MTTPPLLDVATLVAHVSDPDWVIVDCRFDLKQSDAGRSAYEQGHIPGARYAHLDDDLAARPTRSDGRHPLPTPEAFAERLGSWGIANTSTVVVYDEGPGAIAARLWWMLRWVGHERVAVLNGGLKAWELHGLTLERTRPTWERAKFSVTALHDDWVVQIEDLPGLLAQSALLLDARSEERFLGLEEPIDPIAGHVPGARNFPFSKSLASSGTLRTATALRGELEPLVGKRDIADVIAMCGSGVTACHLLLSLCVAGFGDGRLFVGSWSQWIRDPNRPVAPDEPC